MLLPMLFALQATCSAVLPGELPAAEYFRAHLEQNVGRYAEGTVQLANSAVQWLDDLEQRCSERSQREALLQLRRGIERTRAAEDRRLLQAMLAMALARGPEIRVPGGRGGLLQTGMRSSNAEREARRLFEQVLPHWPEPLLLEQLAAMGLATRDRTTLQAAERALERSGSSAEMRALLLLVRSTLAGERTIRTDESFRAPRARRLAAIVAMKDSGAAATAAAREYLGALAEAATAQDVQPFLEDLWPLLDTARTVEFEALPPSERHGWLRREWEWRASESSRTVDERVALHFVRMERALRLYPRLGFRGAPAVAALSWERDAGLPFDERGLLYVRHGEPDEVLNAAAYGYVRQAWVYHHLNSPPGAGVFEFRKPSTRPDWTAVAPEPCSPGTYIGGMPWVPGVGDRLDRLKLDAWDTAGISGIPGDTRRGAGSFPVFMSVYVDWENQLARFDPIRGGRAMGCLAAVMSGNQPRIAGLVESEQLRYLEMSLRARTAYQHARTSENAAVVLRKPWQAVANTYAFRADDGSTLLHALVSVEGDRVTGVAGEGGYRYEVASILAVEDPAARQAARADTTFSFVLPQAAGAGQLIRVSNALSLPPTPAALVRLTLLNRVDESEGQIILIQRDIPPLSGTAPVMSDLVVAEVRDSGPLARGGTRLAPAPGHQVLQDAPIRLFHEVYGVAEDTPARIRIVVLPSRGEGMLSRLQALVQRREGIDVSFDEVLTPASAGTAQVIHDIRAELEPGRYLLTVDVTTATGTMQRSTELFVISRD